jgi:hypothetical protein
MSDHGYKVVVRKDLEDLSSIQLIQDLKADVFYQAQAVKVEGDKVIGLRAQTPTVRNRAAGRSDGIYPSES